MRHGSAHSVHVADHHWNVGNRETHRIIGVAGILTVVPLLELALFLYGLGLIVWFVWLGIFLLRTSRRRASRTPARGAA